MFDLTPRRDLSRKDWNEAYRAARLCKKGTYLGPGQVLAKRWAMCHAV